MAAQFCLRDNSSYVAGSEFDYTWTTITDPFIIYDGIENDKHYAYSSTVPSKYDYFNDDGVIVSHGYVRDAAYSATQEGTALILS